MTYNTERLDLEITRGDTIDIDISFVDVDGLDIPASLFSSGICQIRKRRNQDPILTFDTTATTLVLTDGNINLNGGSSDFQEGYIYDIELTLTTGQVITPAQGKFTFNDDVTWL